MKSRPTVLASAVLALVLLGDSLLYAALPLHAVTFGISVAWVGVLLSANRITRLFVYPLLPRVVELAGLRRFTIGAAALGAISTLWFAVAFGPWPLLAARVAWGIVFGALSLATFAYATQSSDGAGARVGVSLSLREVGPLVSLTAGMLLVTLHGLRPTLALLGVASLFAIPLALLLPDHQSDRTNNAPSLDTRSLRPTRHEALSAIVGFVADGIFPATIALLLTQSGGLQTAAIGAGTLLAVKRVAVIVLSPISGRAADRLGSHAMAVMGVIVTAGGAFLIASTAIAAGSFVLICGAAIASTSIPLAVTSHSMQRRTSSLARLGIARDAGAAVGPLVAMTLFDTAGAPLLYAAAAALLAAGAIGVRVSGSNDAKSRAVTFSARVAVIGVPSIVMRIFIVLTCFDCFGAALAARALVPSPHADVTITSVTVIGTALIRRTLTDAAAS